MNILIATGIYPPDIGGPATYSKLIAEEYTRQGHTITLITYFPAYLSKPETPFRLVTISRAIPKGIRHIVYFLNVLFYGRSADVIFAQDPVSAGVPASLAARILGKKFVIKIVGDYAWEQAMQRYGVSDLLDTFLQTRYPWRIEFLRRVEYRVARRAARIIVPSAYLKSVVARWGVQENLISVVPNGVSQPLVVSRETARERFSLSGTILISVGRLVPWKGFPLLINLMPDLRKLGDITLVIIGDGPDKMALESLRKALKLEYCVLLPGAVSKEALAEYLAAADVFLLNTGYEGFSHQILEAMVAGLPIVTTHAGGNKEIIRDGENALIAEYDNADEWRGTITRVLQDQDLRRRLGESAKKTALLYTPARTIAETFTLLTAL